MKTLVNGVGDNDADYPVYKYCISDGVSSLVWICPIYDSWKSMLTRCYSDYCHSRQPTYIGCTVSKEWHSFMNFRSWMIEQEWEGMHLDKDILKPGNKVYGPDNCIFVSPQLNKFMNARLACRGDNPIGVSWHAVIKKFQSRCRNPFNGKEDHLGYFNDPSAAHEAWRSRKYQHACTYADMQKDPRIAAALRIRYAKPSQSEQVT